jgi:REP element-mobilizing transposase RayT
MTLKVRAGIPSLRTVKLVRDLECSFAASCERGDFRLVHYSIQGNHAHLIVEADSHAALGRGMKAIGARLARAVNRIFGRSGPVLADRYHLHVLRTPNEVRNALAYVLLNARKHAERAGRTLSPVFAVDPASSGRWFAGWLLPLGDSGPAPSARKPVATARSWLLTIGWKRGRHLSPEGNSSSRLNVTRSEWWICAYSAAVVTPRRRGPASDKSAWTSQRPRGVRTSRV